MKRPFILRSVSILAVFTFLEFKQRVLGLVNDVVAHNKCRGLTSLEVTTSKVGVWNNVIDVDILAPKLHHESVRIGLGHKVFSRPRQKESSSTAATNAIEQTLDSILTELNDDSKYVEYWTRREWRSIQAHADVDEYKAKQEQQTGEIGDGGFRYPRNGHVLYLQVGSHVRGPTCVFPNRRSGGDLLRKIGTELPSDRDAESCNSDTPDNGHSNSEGEETANVELITVPAVPGRLLRFQGDNLHAVPRPTDLWLLNFVKGSPAFEPEEDWGRSVILFNTWDDEPPLGLPIDEPNYKDDVSRDNDQPEGHRLDCNKRHEWSQVNLVASSPSSQEDNRQCQNQEEILSTKIWILGDYRRRDHRMQTVKLEASESLREALYQESDVMSTMLKIPS